MISQENSTGRPLADAKWLENHHRAKLPERTAFAKKLAKLNPKNIVDLGCATGLWLELLDRNGFQHGAESLRVTELPFFVWTEGMKRIQK